MAQTQVQTEMIANSAITLAKISNAAANSKLLGSGASGSGSAYSELTLGTGLSMSGTTLNVAALTAATAQASTSGTSIDFTSIPAGTKRITVMFSGVSTNGTSIPLLQIGKSGGIENTGYLGTSGLLQNASSSVTAAMSAGFSLIASPSAATVVHGAITLTLLDATANTWVACGILGGSNAAVPNMVGGSKSLAGTLDRVRITTTNGTDAFDAGSINIMYE